MSFLDHYCTVCKHQKEWHREFTAECSYGFCRCPNPVFDPTPVLVATKDEYQRPVTTVTPPGEKWPARGGGFKTCTCDACVLRYQELTQGGAA